MTPILLAGAESDALAGGGAWEALPRPATARAGDLALAVVPDYDLAAPAGWTRTAVTVPANYGSRWLYSRVYDGTAADTWPSLPGMTVLAVWRNAVGVEDPHLDAFTHYYTQTAFEGPVVTLPRRTSTAEPRALYVWQGFDGWPGQNGGGSPGRVLPVAPLTVPYEGVSLFDGVRTRHTYVGHTPMATLGAGPDPAPQARFTSEGQGVGFASAASYTYVLVPTNDPPNPPDRLTPADGTAVAYGDLNQLRWRHTDPEDDPQDGYEVSVRPAAATAWPAAVRVETPNSLHNLDPSLPISNYTWRVRTISRGQVGAWSATGHFQVANRVAGPTWTDPANGQTINTRQHLLRWSGLGTQYRIRSVRDVGGLPDPTVEYAATGPVQLNSGPRERLWTFPANGRTEWLLLEEAGPDGLWSVTAQSRVQVSYTLPERAQVQLRGDQETLALIVQVITPTPGAGKPVTARHTVRVRRRGDTGPGLLVSETVARNGLARYRFPALGADYEVLVGSVGENGAVDPGAWTSSAAPRPDGPTARYDAARYDTDRYT